LNIEQARQAIAALRVQPCRMSHERVMFSGGAPVRRTGGGEQVFVRAGLCSWDERLTQLACAHTTARYRLAELVDALEQLRLLDPDDAAATRVRVSELADAIHAADWAKSDLETRYAAASDAREEESRAAIRQKILELEEEHSRVCKELEEIVLRLRHIIGSA
jgi:hypothetical protein